MALSIGGVELGAHVPGNKAGSLKADDHVV
jgi:hypothetical protein